MQNIEHDIKKYDQYFITKNYKKDSLNEYLEYIEKVLNQGVKLVQFRSKNLSKNQYSIVSKEIYNLCKKYKSFFIINNIDNLEFNKFCDGIQLTSDNLKCTNINSIDNKYILFGSCHNEQEINICNKNNIDAILLSSVNSSTNKVGIGWSKFKMLADISEKPVFALGGLNYINDINTVKEYGGHGIAAISYYNQLFRT